MSEQRSQASRRNFLRAGTHVAGLGMLPSLVAGEKPTESEFVGISTCLTQLGVGSDYPDLKAKYFEVLQKEVDQKILLKLFDDYRLLVARMTPPNKIAETLLDKKRDTEVSDVAKSIMSMWYLGIWQTPGGTSDEMKVISAEAYINGQVWSLIEAHPFGYSRKFYGEWGSLPSQRFGPGITP